MHLWSSCCTTHACPGGCLWKVFGHNDPFAIGRFIAEAERCLQMLDDQLASSGCSFVLGQRYILVDVSCSPYCASAYWANVDISEISHLLAWIEMLHQRPSFRTGLTLPFSRPAFWPSCATPEDIEAEIAQRRSVCCDFQISQLSCQGSRLHESLLGVISGGDPGCAESVH